MSIILSSIKSFFRKIPAIWYYPLLLSIPFLFLITFGINGSSVGTFTEAIDGNAGINKIIGSNRWIRSDEYLATTPILLSQGKNGNPQKNESIGTGIELGVQTNMPVKDIFTLFKIPAWLFLIIENEDIAFSFFWWIRVYILAIGSYLLLFELTKKNYTISILGSLSFIFTPFAHWWWNFELIGYATIIIFSLIKLINAKNIRGMIFPSISFYYFSISFALLLYPPFQIPVIWASIFIFLGVLANNFSDIKKDPLIGKKFLFFCITIFTVFATILLFYLKYENIIEVITNTSYPGIRFFSGGGLPLSTQFNGFYNILLQSDYNGVPIGQRNQSEAANFFLLYPAVILFSIISLFKEVKRKQVDYLLICLSFWIVLLAIWSYIPLPEWFAKYTFLAQVPPSRISIGLGFSSYILCFYFLSTKIKPKKSENIWIILISIVSWSLILLLGYYFLSNTPQYFTKPMLLSPEVKLALISSFFFLVIYFLLSKKILLFSLAFFGFSFLSTALVHPLYKGLDSINKTHFAETVKKYQSNEENKWIVYGDHRFAQYILANGGYVLNGIHYYPLHDMWQIIDPEKKYFEIYNRYAHIHFDNKGPESPLLELIYADQISVNMDPCDNRLKTLNVQYFLMPEFVEKSCLEYKESVDTTLRGPLYIYQRINN